MNNAIAFAVLLLLLAGLIYVLHFVYRVLRGERQTSIRKAGADPSIKTVNSSDKKSASTNLLSVLLIILVVGGYFVLKNKGDLLTSVNKPEFELTATQLYNEFNDNELAAYAKYKDKVISVSGRYAASGVSLGNPWILLDAGSKFFTIQCFLKSNSVQAAASLKKGSNVRVKGIVSGKTGNVFLDSCIVE